MVYANKKHALTNETNLKVHWRHYEGKEEEKTTHLKVKKKQSVVIDNNELLTMLA